MSSFMRSASQLLLQELSSSPNPSVLVDSPGQVGSSPQQRHGNKRRSFLDEYDRDGLESSIDNRIATYTWLTWQGNADISPLLCARYGWVCMEKCLLQCVSCKEYLSCHLPHPSERKQYWNSIGEMKDSVISAHTTTCPWKSNPTPVSSFCPDIFAGNRSLLELRSALESMLNLDFRNVRVCSAQDIGLSIDDVTSVVVALKALIGESSPTLTASLSSADPSPALLLALTGWRKGASLSHHSSLCDTSMVTCDRCQRSLGLWMFSTEAASESPYAWIEESRKRRGVSKQCRVLNPVEQHQPWCVWLQPSDASPALCSLPTASNSDDQTPLADAEQLPQLWKAAVKLICNPQQKTSAVTEFSIAKQLLDDAISRVANEKPDGNNDTSVRGTSEENSTSSS